MQQYINAVIYIIIGFCGSIFHYLKKRYIDNTTTQSLWNYLIDHKTSTFKTIGMIVSAEYGLSLAHVDGFLTLPEFIGALSAGYTVDSGLNRTGENQPSNP